MVGARRRSRVAASVQDGLVRQFVAGATARSAAALRGVNRHMATLYSHKLREVIASRLAEERPRLSVDVDEGCFGGARAHINGIENFRSQAKRHLRRFNGVPRQRFPLYLKERGWRFNRRPTANLLKLLRQWAKEDML